MNKVKKTSFPIILVIGLIYWSANVFYPGPDWIRLLALNTIQFAVGIWSTFWIFKVYRTKKTQARDFWLFLSMGTFFSSAGTLSWMILLYANQVTESPPSSYFMWLLSYTFYFAALIYKLHKSQDSSGLANTTYFFNTLIYMIAATSVMYHYLLYPVYKIDQYSLWQVLFTLSFQIADLGILFFIITLYYILQFKNTNSSLIYLIIGLSLQIVGDFLFAQLTIEHTYEGGKIVDFVWTIALLYMGYTGFYYQEKTQLFALSRGIYVSSLWKEFIFPYASIIVLSIFLMQSYDWNLNALSLGWLIIFLLIIIRQSLTVFRHNKLLLKLDQLAYLDTLTGFRNRTAFIEDTELLFKDSKHSFTFLLLQVDRIKTFNDVFGQQTGERMIKEISKKLNMVAEKNGLIYRISEDEFMFILKNKHQESVIQMNEHIFSLLKRPFQTSEFTFNLVTNIGVSSYPDQSKSVKDVLKHTTEALYQARQYGNHSFAFYNEELVSSLIRRLELETQLRDAINQNQLSVHYQPKVHLETQSVIGMEALIRWEHPDQGFISPAEFIPVAEESGLINELGEWVLRTACLQNKQLQELGFPNLRVSVNVSALQFQNPHFCEMIETVLRETRLDPEWLELEITESIVQNIKESITILQYLKSRNIRTSIDDFGTGYSSLSVLEQLPIDTLKIDKSFIDRLSTTRSSSMVKTIIELGLNLDLNLVAEGIETVEQRKMLKSYGCHIGQGYLFSRPLAFVHFIHFLESHHSYALDY